MLRHFFGGGNALLFCYGPSASGKTFTIQGDDKNPGLMPNILKAVFSSISAARRANQSGAASKPTMADPHVFPLTPGMDYNVWISYLECYNEKVYDLLRKREEKVGANGKPIHVPEQAVPAPLDIKYTKNNVPVISSVEPCVESLAQAMQWLNHGASNRSTGFTQINKTSSRSHAIFTIKLTQTPIGVTEAELKADPSLVKYSKFTVVDLAGSERTGKSQASGDRLREASNINNSLLTLKRCMKALQQNQMIQNQAALNSSTSSTSETSEKRLSVTSKRLSTSSTAKPSAPQPPQIEVVPFRDSTLTKLLREYLQGEGKCSVIVTINPSPTEYEESLHALDFGTITKAVKTTTCKKKMIAKSASPPQPIPFSLTHTRSTSKPSLTSKTSHSALNLDKLVSQPLLLSLSQSLNTSTHAPSSSVAPSATGPALNRSTSSIRFDSAIEASSPSKSALNRSRMVHSNAPSPMAPLSSREAAGAKPEQDTTVKALFRSEEDPETTIRGLSSSLFALQTPEQAIQEQEIEYEEVMEFDQMELVQEVNKLRTEIAEAENRNLELEMNVRAEIALEMANRLSSLDEHYKQHTAKMVRNVEEKYERMLAHYGKIHSEEQESAEQAAAAQEAETHENVYSMLLEKETELEGVKLELTLTTQGLQRVSAELAQIRDSTQSEMESLQDKHREEICMLRNKLNHTLAELDAMVMKVHQYESGEVPLPVQTQDSISGSAASSTQDLDDSASSSKKKKSKHKREGTFSEVITSLLFGGKESKKAPASSPARSELTSSSTQIGSSQHQQSSEMDLSTENANSAKEIEEEIEEKKPARNIKKRKGKAANEVSKAINKVSKRAEDTTPTSPMVKSESMFEVATPMFEDDVRTAKGKLAEDAWPVKRKAKHASAQATTRQPRRAKAFRSVQLEPIRPDEEDLFQHDEANRSFEEKSNANDSMHEEPKNKSEEDAPRTPLAAAKMLGLKGRKLASPSSPHLALSPPVPAPVATTKGRGKKVVSSADDDEDYEEDDDDAEENYEPSNTTGHLPSRTPLTKRLRSRRPQDDVAVEPIADTPPPTATTRRKKETVAATTKGIRRRGAAAVPKYLDF
jgi:hypothetical protein